MRFKLYCVILSVEFYVVVDWSCLTSAVVVFPDVTDVSFALYVLLCNKCVGTCQLFFSGFVCGAGCPVGS